MCVLAFAWRAHPQWPLVLIGNRDERHDRPAAPLGRWPKAPHVLAGRDLVAGGGWLGVSEQGRLAVVTNIRGYGPSQEDRPSRGLVVRDVLIGEGAYADPAATGVEAFNPLNLIAVRDGRAEFWTNRPSPRHHLFAPGVYGLSNGGLEDGWPKTDRLKAFLTAWLAEGGGDIDPLLDALGDEHRPKDEALPATGLPLDRERLASAIFIRHDEYGTRCSSAILVGADGQGVFAERRFDAAGRGAGETRLAFTWPSGR